jgi:hypothetical protein
VVGAAIGVYITTAAVTAKTSTNVPRNSLT